MTALVAPQLPFDPYWKFTNTTFYIYGDVNDIWSEIAAYVLEQGGWSVINVQPQKASMKAECLGSVWVRGFVVKIKVFKIDTGILAVEWKRKSGCGIKSYNEWLLFRSRFCQPVD